MGNTYPARVAKQSLAIAHVTPQPWGKPHEVNEFVGGVAREQAAAGHRVLVAAPSPSRTQIRDARRVIRQAEDDEDLLFSAAGLPRAGDDGPPVLAVGQGIALPRGPGPRAAPVPLDVSRTLERLFETAHFDIVHVHDPFAPSTSSTALRFSTALNVGSFHEPTERVLSTQVARPLVEIFFGRLDARTASTRGTVELLERFFPGSYDLVLPGADGAGGRDLAGRGRRRRGWRPAGPAGLLPRRGARGDAPLRAGAAPAAGRPRLGGGDLARAPGRAAAGDPAGDPRPSTRLRPDGLHARAN